MEKLKNNLKRILRRQAEWSAVRPEDQLGKVQPDGSLSGIDYRQDFRGSAWQPGIHLCTMVQLAATHPETAGRMLDFWVRTDSISENWWWPQIGIPLRLCKTMLLLDRKAEEGSPVRTILDRSSMQEKYTGQNKVWLAEINLMKGLLYDDPAMVDTGREAILSEIRISENEGLKPDWSFHQHGAQLQFGNYGLSWFEDMSFWAVVFAGTRYALPPEQLELIAKYYNNGLRWTLTGEIMDINACGRQIVDPMPESKYRTVRFTAGLLRDHGCLDRQSDFPEGSVCYPCSGYLIHRCRDFFFSVKMCSSRLRGSETCNSENMQGLYAGDGATMLYPAARWDKRSLALRDWRKVPGTTELQNSVSLVPRGPAPHNARGGYCCFARGNAAAAMMRFRNDELQADKAYFCFGSCIVCMGGGIRAQVPGVIATTLVQAFRSGPAELAGEKLPDGETVSSGKVGFTFDGMKYLLPETGDFHFLPDFREGNWNTIDLEYPSTPVSGPMFTVWQEHPADEPGRYLYVIHPEHEPSPRLEYLRGDGILGFHSAEGVMIAFFRPGELAGIKMKEPGLYLDFEGIREIIPLSI